jgi:hypothetical protein
MVTVRTEAPAPHRGRSLVRYDQGEHAVVLDADETARWVLAAASGRLRFVVARLRARLRPV